MRVHRLEITAFGPFAGTQAIDFEPLNAAGVFLLTGQTGAGKTSILDAICFGLFGQVPGVRDKAKAYRSHHAPRDVAPRIVLEVTLQGRRLRLTRLPVWSRPSRRARSGYVEEKARALVEELVDGAWLPRSSRVDEVGHLVSRLLGLNRDQFCQVVMLPQGDFQALLRAGGRERQHILETLFGTQQFQAVERWLAEHRRLQARRCREHEETIGRLAARLHEVCVPVDADDPPFDESELASNPHDLLRSVRQLVESGTTELGSARAAVEGSASRAKHAEHARDESRTLADRRERHLEARRHHDALLATRDVVAARQTRVRRARAAEPLLPLVTLTSEAEGTVDRSRLAATAAVARVTTTSGLPLTGSPDHQVRSTEEASVLARRLADRIARLESMVAVECECDDLTMSIREVEAPRSALVEAIDGLTASARETPGRIADLRTRLETATATVVRGAEAEHRRRSAADALEAAREVAACDALGARLNVAILVARETSVGAVEEWLAARERYLAGLAAELAGLLADGEQCPVCGSSTHPSPATPTSTHVTAHQEAVLLREATRARDVLAGLEAERADALASRCEAVVRSGGLDERGAAAAVEQATTELAMASTASVEHAALSREHELLVAEEESHGAALELAVTELARSDERLDGWQRRLALLRTRLVEELGGALRLADVLAQAADDAGRCRVLEAALRSAEEAERALDRARERLHAAVAASDFADRDEVAAACLSQAEIAHEEALGRAHEVDLAGWSRVLADPVLVAAAGASAPDLTRLESEAAESADAAHTAADRAASLERRQSRLEELVVELDEMVAALVPLLAARDLAEGLAGLCAGTSTDNVTRTALSHYVLATRLAQVVAAANLRLDSVGGGRYQLEHTMTRGAGDARGGLGLVMRDTHTDQGRDPATLSGGETFYVSLSLALGLADVVTAEAGGAELSTLFVDEGFGSLDDDTRDEVLDELDALRSGGRTVGLVSHLAELRVRCPVQLHVVASAGGSRCLPVTGTGC